MLTEIRRASKKTHFFPEFLKNSTKNKREDKLNVRFVTFKRLVIASKKLRSIWSGWFDDDPPYRNH